MRLFKLNPTSRRYALECVQNAPDGYVVRVNEPTRSLDQNAKLWPMLEDVAEQVVWYGQKLTKDEWKDVFTAALKKAKVVPGLDGGFVVCGQRTSIMPKREFSELIELSYAFGAEKEVKWSEQAQVFLADFRRAA
jgi:hypothetical protein